MRHAAVGGRTDRPNPPIPNLLLQLSAAASLLPQLQNQPIPSIGCVNGTHPVSSGVDRGLQQQHAHLHCRRRYLGARSPFDTVAGAVAVAVQIAAAVVVAVCLERRDLELLSGAQHGL